MAAGVSRRRLRRFRVRLSVRPYGVMIIRPICPSCMHFMAATTSPSANVLPITGVSLPAANRSRKISSASAFFGNLKFLRFSGSRMALNRGQEISACRP